MKHQEGAPLVANGRKRKVARDGMQLQVTPLGAISARRPPVADSRKSSSVQPITARFFFPSRAAECTADKPASQIAPECHLGDKSHS